MLQAKTTTPKVQQWCQSFKEFTDIFSYFKVVKYFIVSLRSQKCLAFSLEKPYVFHPEFVLLVSISQLRQILTELSSWLAISDGGFSILLLLFIAESMRWNGACGRAMARVHTEVHTCDDGPRGYSLSGGQKGGSAWVSCVCCSGLGSTEAGGQTEPWVIPRLFSASDRSCLPWHRSPWGAFLKTDLKPHTWLIALSFRRHCGTLVWRAVDLREMVRAFSITSFQKNQTDCPKARPRRGTGSKMGLIHSHYLINLIMKSL